MSRSTVIVGGSLAGLRVAETLRRLGHDRPIDVLSDETHLPYDRPPLSKGLLTGAQTFDDIRFRTAKDLAERDIQVHCGIRATSLDVKRKVVDASGRPFEFNDLVIATGARPRTIAGSDTLAGVHSIRTLDDAERIRSDFASATSLVVVGAGFIGAEVASSARTVGLEVTVVEALPHPLARAVGERVGAACASLHRAAGTTLICGVGVDHLEGDDRVRAVALTDGTVLDTDLVVVGIGVIPNVEWLAESGLTTTNGVICDEYMCASPGIYALGDVACWTNPRYGESMRIEHWTTTVEQALVVGHNVANPSERRVCDAIPYFWSDQYGHRIQFAGRAQADEVAVIDTQQSHFLALYRRGEQLIGALAIDGTTPLMQLRGRMMVGNDSWADSIDFVESLA